MNFETFKDLTRIEQTLFGLPFVISGALLSFLGHPFSGYSLIWVLPAFLMARISGMAFNQLIDRKIDAKNPRTKNRAIPSGRASPVQARVIAFSSLALFLLICLQINFLCFLLSPIAAFLIVIYSYMKRVHASCHLVLGMIHFLGPVMAHVALSGSVSLSAIFLGMASCMSIAGNDIVYAIQDYEFDRTHHLQSIPSRFGIKKSLTLAKILHGLCVVFLACVGFFGKLIVVFYGVIPVTACIFYHFHSTISQQYKKTHSVSGVESVFFFSNVAVSFSTFIFILFSVLWVALS